MKKTLLAALFCLLAATMQGATTYRQYLNLSGQWQMALVREQTPMPPSVFPDFIELPGTTDTNRKGSVPARTDETTHLTRLHSFVGRAWYRRRVTIPASWKGYDVRLHLERTKPTRLFIDGQEAGSCDDISTPQEYVVGSLLTPGDHELTLCVDNTAEAVPPQIVSNSHAYTEDTQTNWNGVIGQMYLERVPAVAISDLTVTTAALDHRVEVGVDIEGRVRRDTEVRFIIVPWGSDVGYIFSRQLLKKSKDGMRRMRVSFTDDSLSLWSEFHPTLYRIRVEVDGHDTQEKPFGLCQMTTQGTQFAVNGHTMFLRGRHDACVFPLTGHVPMDVGQWRRYFQICRGYGINHVRFHSWCPPEACFMAADIEGVYLQPELPFWGDFKKDDHRLMTFLLKEGMNILRQYGHHPSFKMMALGNELWGDIGMMKTFTDTFRKRMPDKLFTFGSNYYLGYQGWKEGMDYFTTCRNGGEQRGEYNTHTRGSFSFADAHDGGILNHFYPNSSVNFSQAIAGLTVPVISHETAQFQTYPDYAEIAKYQGVLYPYNMEVFRSRLQKAGMLDQAADFHRASGLWSMQLYKADIEMDLRTPGFGGFQLLDLQDYPGQGSAYVGVLDAFMESKGLIKPDEFRGFCSPVVPLFVADKFCFTTDEPLTGRVQIANYAEPVAPYRWNDGRVEVSVSTAQGDVIARQTMPIPADSTGLFQVGTFSMSTSALTKAQKLTLTLRAYYDKNAEQPFTNSYPLWVFPQQQPTKKGLRDGISTAHHLDDDLLRRLERGERVLLMPDSTDCGNLTVGGLFQTDYWNYRMFKTISENNHRPVSPGTLGILTNPAHPIFADFPTDMHTSWQWFPIIKASRPFMLDNTSAHYRPIVQVIDNIERNHKLGLVFEFAVGKGRLLVCMSPLDRLTQYAEARQLLASIRQYMASEHFQPQTRITGADLRRLFSTPVTEGKIGELNNISPY